jgi:hypothetical protein
MFLLRPRTLLAMVTDRNSQTRVLDDRCSGFAASRAGSAKLGRIFNALIAGALFNNLTRMIKTSSNARSLFAFAAFSLLGCGGAEVGESCDDAGSTDDCEDGAICTNEDQGAVCRLLCKETAECPPAHSCNGVSGSNLKSCQPD